MKKNNKALYLIIFILMFVIGAVLGLLSKDSKKDLSRTIMIYMVGSDLESRSGLATVDLKGIDYDSVKKQNMNVLLIAGGSKKWHNNFIEDDETSIYELKEDGFEKVKEQKQKSMGKSSVLSDFINYTYDNYKTDKYDLIFWNHGGAIDGSEYDELNNYDNLTLSELKDALSDTKFNKNNKLEIVFFNTCLNGTIEVANIFKDYSEYMVASEEITYGSPYTSELKFINDIEKQDSTVDIGKKFISTYKEKIEKIKKSSIFLDDSAIYSTYSLIKLSNVDKLTDSISEFFSDINVTENFNSISKIRANMLQYGKDEPAYDMIDLYNLVEKLQDLSPKKAKSVLDNFENTIVYNWATDSRSRGISIYFPYKGKTSEKLGFIKVYDNIDVLDSYKDFISEFNNIKVSGNKKKTSYTKNSISIQKGIEKVSDFTLELSDEQVETFATAQYVVYRNNNDGFYKPIYIGGKAELDDNTLTASIKDKQLKVVSKTNPDEEYTLVLIETDNNDKYIKYETKIILQKVKDDWRFDHAVINLLYDKETREFDILDVMYDDDNFANSAIVNTEDYDSVVFSISSGWDILDSEGNYVGPQYNEEGHVIGDGVITGFEEKPGNYEFELETFDENYDYYCAFIITDVYGNISSSQLIKMN